MRLKLALVLDAKLALHAIAPQASRWRTQSVALT